MTIKSALFPINLLSHDDDPDWKVQRFPFTDAGPEVLAKMLPGFLVKFDATAQAVLDPANPNDRTVAVALNGSFNQRQIHYANAWSQGSSPTPLSAAAIQRLRSLDIFLDPSVPTGAFSP